MAIQVDIASTCGGEWICVVRAGAVCNQTKHEVLAFCQGDLGLVTFERD